MPLTNAYQGFGDIIPHRAWRRTPVKSFSKDTVSGIFVIIGLFFVVYMSVSLGDISIFSARAYSLYGHFKAISGLQPGNRVELLGIKIGRVDQFSIDADKNLAIVKLKIDKGVTLHDDAVATIETDGLIGDKYIKIHTGGKGKILKRGDFIKTAESSFDELAETVKGLPIQQISDKLLSALTGIDRIVNIPVLEESLVNLNETLKHTRKFVQDADASMGRIVAGFENVENDLRALLSNIDAKIDPMASDFKAVSEAAQQTLRQAEKTLSLKEGRAAEVAVSMKEAGDAVRSAALAAKLTLVKAEKALANIDSLTAEDSPELYQVRSTLRELSAAARSIKNWAEYLERHPEALLRGKGSAQGR